MCSDCVSHRRTGRKEREERKQLRIKRKEERKKARKERREREQLLYDEAEKEKRKQFYDKLLNTKSQGQWDSGRELPNGWAWVETKKKMIEERRAEEQANKEH